MKYDFVFELPHYGACCGGVNSTISLARALRERGYEVAVWFQQKGAPQIDNDLVERGDFPKCKVAVTYSDTPYLEELMGEKVADTMAIWMLSYGMAIDRERKNVLTPGVKVWASSKRTEVLIKSDGGSPVYVGNAHNWENWYPETEIGRERAAVFMSHGAKAKRTALAEKVCFDLLKQGFVDRVYSFGGSESEAVYTDTKRYMGPLSRERLRSLFSRCSVYVMPSVSEGFNWTPAEATLCGCPAVICDGAIPELYESNVTCFVAEKDNGDDIRACTKAVLKNPLAGHFRENMMGRLYSFTWEKVCVNIEKSLGLK